MSTGFGRNRTDTIAVTAMSIASARNCHWKSIPSPAARAPTAHPGLSTDLQRMLPDLREIFESDKI